MRSLDEPLPACGPGVFVASFAVDAVAHDARTGEVHLVEGLVAAVLTACDEGASRSVLVGDVVAALGVTEADADAAVTGALDQLVGAGLLV